MKERQKHCLEDKFDIYAFFKCWNVDAIVFDLDNTQKLKLQKTTHQFLFRTVLQVVLKACAVFVKREYYL